MDEDIHADYWQVLLRGGWNCDVTKADANVIENAIHNGDKLITVTDIYGADNVLVIDQVVIMVNWTREIGARYKQAHADCKTYDSDD